MGIPRRLVAASLSYLVAATLGACSGGGKSGGVAPGTCERATTAGASGPGDASNYFPIDVGRRWTYRNETTNEVATTTITGTQGVGAEVASVFTTTYSGSTPSGTELVVKRPGGVFVLSDQSLEPPLDQLYPSLVLPFPVQETAPMQQATCNALDVGDLDGDGKADHADMVASVRVFRMGETAQVPSGYFTNVAHAQTTAHLTVTGTSRGTLVVDASQDDWYAIGVGRVVSLLQFTVQGVGSESTTVSLQSYTQAPVATALPPAATALIAPVATTPPRPSLEETALTLARKSFRMSP